MRDDLRDLARLDAVIERQVEMVRHLDGLVARDQCGQRNDAAVARREAGAFPHIAEQRLGVLLERGSDHSDIVERIGVQHVFGLLRLNRKRNNQAEQQNRPDETFHLNLANVVSQEDETVRGR